jgi:hypothetical protein
MRPSRNQLGEKAVVMLATAFVLGGGAAASTFVIATNSATPINTLLIFAGCCLGAGLILWLLREPDPLTPRAKQMSWFRRSKPKTIHYELRVRSQSPQPNESSPQPPTAESIRELAKEGLHTWVPSPAKSRRTP